MQSKTTMPKLTRKATKLRLENLIYRIGGIHLFTDSIEDAIDCLQLCIICTKHDLESTQRELQAAMGKR